ncbi:hypothetical protein JCM15457_1134 [Liquorilactobacillus sucicola DSM 21376 = JCM 15457]|uniref:hypothetical protein n=1 Tax=Liquorilactobacillus sucicola TaxID=519050 RepID=UPI0004366646|nr:hypothetical protein [Liquorilactobacillus sucicola]GAJ26217.1 hypothetical protein JCM15457_1134 [Liquorilactobacillus sucicola DSM 21376 = JCM 15457]
MEVKAFASGLLVNYAVGEKDKRQHIKSYESYVGSVLLKGLYTNLFYAVPLDYFNIESAHKKTVQQDKV